MVIICAVTYLVTGALGAIGAWTVRSLLDRGHDVVTYDLGGSDHRLRLALTDDELAALTRVEGDVTDLDAARARDRRARRHRRHPPRRAAGPVRPRRPGRGRAVNVAGTVNVLEAVRRRGDGMGPVVYASSIAALPDAGEYPSTLYGVFKLANEGTAAGYFADYGVSVGRAAPAHALRPRPRPGPDVGADRGDGRRRAKGEAFEIPFGGSLQLQYSADAGEAFVRASEAERRGRLGPQPRRPGRDRRGDHRGDRARGARGGRAASPPRAIRCRSRRRSTRRSFTELVGGPSSRPFEEGVAEAIAAFS